MDQKALKILCDTYWSPQGWKKNPSTAPADFIYAKNAGCMFDPVDLSHDEVVERIINARETVRPSDVAKAFLASLSTRRLDWRSALGSYAVARHFRRHPCSPKNPDAHSPVGNYCTICGMAPAEKQADLNVLNFERCKWGGVRHDHPIYVAMDLELFGRSATPIPTADDLAILRAILSTAGELKSNATLTELRKAFAKHLKSNQDERSQLIEILGCCGILEDPAHPGFFADFTPFVEREGAPADSDWNYPVEWWRGQHATNDQAVQFWFGEMLDRES